MIRLLIFADDFTGGLDTGVQFAAKGIPTRVTTRPDADLSQAAGDCQVLVLVAETRHMPADQAGETVYAAVERAVRLGIPHIYKKTDSALRGNIGAELTAALRASGAQVLPFLPALPGAGRVTRGGVHYVDGAPVSESPFGRDPFAPVRESNVARLLALQSDVPARVGSADRLPEGDGLWVFDAQTDGDLARAGRRLMERGLLRVSAGCAGFAAHLPELLDLKAGDPPRRPALESGLFVLCGSVHPVTRRQLAWAEAHGFTRLHIRPEQKLDPGYFETAAGRAALEGWKAAGESHPWTILDANDAGEDNAQSATYAAERGMSAEEVRRIICGALGGILPRMLEGKAGRTLLITGGDTLMQCMNRLGVCQMEPLLEVFPGVVLSRFRYGGGTRHIITKSGGFGRETLLTDLKAMLEENPS